MVESIPTFVLYLKTNFVVYIESLDLGRGVNQERKDCFYVVWTNVKS